MPKSSRGGRRATATVSGGAGSAPFIAPQPQTPQQVLQALNNGDTVNFNNFMALSDDEKADAITTILKQDLPNFLDDGDFQKFLYYTEVEGRPQIVSDSALDKMKGKSLYRTVNAEYDPRTDVNYKPKEIYNQIAKGDFTRVSSRGGSAYGKGLYFADSYGGSAVYGRGGNSLIMRAKLSNNAKPIRYHMASAGTSSEISSGSKLGRALSRMSHKDAVSTYALIKGYNVLDGGSYKCVLDRSALALSDKTKAPTGSSWN